VLVALVAMRSLAALPPATAGVNGMPMLQDAGIQRRRANSNRERGARLQRRPADGRPDRRRARGPGGWMQSQ